MSNLKDFTVYSNNFDTGDIIQNDKTIIDDKGSSIRFYKYFDLYDKPNEDNSRFLVGQFVYNNEIIRKNLITYGYSLNNSTYFLKTVL